LTEWKLSDLLDNMESTSQAASLQLGTVERARRTVWAPKPIPRWYRLGVGVAAGTFWALQDAHNRVLLFVSMAIYAVVIGVLLGAVARKQGGLTRPKGMPRRLQMAWAESVLWLLAVIAAVGGVVNLLHLPHPWLWFAALGAVALYVGIDVGARVYKRAFDRWSAENTGGKP
jgi:uncharacterized membrane protein AbrB (regulator of aidB expression)